MIQLMDFIGGDGVEFGLGREVIHVIELNGNGSKGFATEGVVSVDAERFDRGFELTAELDSEGWVLRGEGGERVNDGVFGHFGPAEEGDGHDAAIGGEEDMSTWFFLELEDHPVGVRGGIERGGEGADDGGRGTRFR